MNQIGFPEKEARFFLCDTSIIMLSCAIDRQNKFSAQTRTLNKQTDVLYCQHL
jgi:hypothetical protein